jgi:hypothetical protein
MFSLDVFIFLKSLDPLLEFEFSVMHKLVSTDRHKNWIPQKIIIVGARGSVEGRSVLLQAWGSRVRFPMRPLDF